MNAPRIELTRAGAPTPWLGQLVPIDVALVRAQGDAPLAAFSFDDVEMNGAIALWREHAPPPEQREASGQAYLVQHRTLLVFPQDDGVLHVPRITARFSEPGATRPTVVHSDELTFSAALPRQQGDAPLLISARVSLSQDTDRALAGLRVGDGFTRTFVLRALDSDPIVLPELTFPAPAGLRVYPAVPHAAASSERGEIVASRTFSATYVVERVGHYALPAPSVRWLQPASGRYLEATAPTLEFWARPNPALGLHMLGTAPEAAAWTLASTGLLFGSLAWWVLRRARRGPFAWELAFRAKHAERRAFRALLRALGSENALATLRSTYGWLTKRFVNRTDRTLTRLRGTSRAAEHVLGALEGALYASDKPRIDWRALHKVLVRGRRALAAPESSVSALEVNPIATESQEP